MKTSVDVVTAAAPGVLKGVDAAKDLALKTVAEETVTLYRGVNQTHHLYDEAKAGIVRPNGGTTTPLEHNAVANATLRSPYTSWTTNPDVAMNYAVRPAPFGTGVVMEAEVPRSQTVLSPNLKFVKIPGGGVVSESEVLVKGTVLGTPKVIIWQW